MSGVEGSEATRDTRHPTLRNRHGAKLRRHASPLTERPRLTLPSLSAPDVLPVAGVGSLLRKEGGKVEGTAPHLRRCACGKPGRLLKARGDWILQEQAKGDMAVPEPTEADLERLKALFAKAINQTAPLKGNKAKEAVMDRARQLALQGIPFERGIQQAKRELGV